MKGDGDVAVGSTFCVRRPKFAKQKMLTDKQREFIHNANRRWNIKVGATRSGKTYCDLFMIPKRIRACTGSGTVVLIGTTVTTLCRNILDPLREKWGELFVGKPTSKDTVMLFGKKCWLIGALRGEQAAKLQGSGIEYAYGDEITTWSRQVFEMLKSRLDRPESHFDGTCNPASPDHWLKKFLDSDADIHCQHYTIDDNPNLDPAFVRMLKSEYAGTVYYDRFILGKWCAPEGMIYRRFANDTVSYTVSDNDMRLGRLTRITVGVDFGGNASGTAFVACGTVGYYDTVIALMSERHMGGTDSDRLGELFCEFIEAVTARYGEIQCVYCDSAEPVLIRGLKKAAVSRGLTVQIRNALKSPVNDRIRLVCRLMAQGRFLVTERCDSLTEALCTAHWRSDSLRDERKDDGSSDIDSLDALEYAIERDMQRLCG